MGKILQRLLMAMGLKRPKHHYHVDINLAESLETLALEQARDPDEIAADILAEGIARREQTEQHFEHWKILSPREREVTALVCRGYTNKEIGEELSISINTAKTHVTRIYRKLGVSSRAGAVTRARELDLV